jgi:UDP-glucose 4-epimerase
MKVLVTGGAGFIGSHIVDSLLEQGHDVVVFDDMSSGRMENLRDSKNRIEFIKGDILDYDSLKRASQDVDVISHQAAQLEIFRCIDNPIYDLKTNTIGTVNVLRAAAENSVKKIINASSACVYGQAEETPQYEDHPRNPNWEYGVSKLAAEKYCEIYENKHGMTIPSLRYGIVYGEREWFGRVMPIFIKRVMENKPLVIFGDGEQLRDFIHVSDIVSMHDILMEKNVSGPYNVSTSIGTSVNKLVGVLKEVSGKDVEIIYDDVEEGTASKHFPERKRIPSELKKMILGNKKAMRLGWKPNIDLKTGVKRFYEWVSENPDFWKTGGTVRV